MNIVLSHISAARYWLIAATGHDACPRESAVDKPVLHGFELDRIPSICRQADDVHILAPSRQSMHAAKGFRMHLQEGNLPNGSIIRIGDGIAVTSPELTFFEMANVMSFYELVMFGYRLCGIYIPLKGTLGKRKPLASTDTIAQTIAHMDGRKGVARARRALRFVCNESASPRETSTSMLCCLNMKDGGYKMRPQGLNRKVELTPEEKALIGTENCRIDLYWEGVETYRTGKATGLEYDGRDYHSEPWKSDKDETRKLVLESKGIALHTIRDSQLVKPALFDMVMKNVMRDVGMRDWETRAPDAEANSKLRTYLFGGNLWPSLA